MFSWNNRNNTAGTHMAMNFWSSMNIKLILNTNPEPRNTSFHFASKLLAHRRRCYLLCDLDVGLQFLTRYLMISMTCIDVTDRLPIVLHRGTNIVAASFCNDINSGDKIIALNCHRIITESDIHLCIRKYKYKQAAITMLRNTKHDILTFHSLLKWLLEIIPCK